MNNVIIVGKLFTEPSKDGFMVVKITRNYKNDKGLYDSDFIPVKIFDNLIDNLLEYCTLGDTIAIKGTLKSSNDSIYVMADRVSFLSSKKSE